MAKGWTEERRRKQAEMIRKHKPWEKSTGPRTPAGKDRTRMNALKSGIYSHYGDSVRQMLFHNREFLRHVYVAELAKRLDKQCFMRNELIKALLETDI